MKKSKPYKGFYLDVAKLYGVEYKVYGPYIREPDKRKIVVLYNGKFRTTKQYPKVKLEIKLGRLLSKDETVDHIDNDATNNKFSNLRLLSREENARLGSVKCIKPVVKCAWCKTKFKVTRNQITAASLGKAGPFCSKKCSGKYGKEVQLTSTTRKRKKIQVHYRR